MLGRLLVLAVITATAARMIMGHKVTCAQKADYMLTCNIYIKQISLYTYVYI